MPPLFILTLTGCEPITTRAREFFEDDVECPVRYEPSGSDFLSPCLAEAALMSRLLPQEAFVEWLDDFLPAPDSEAFSPMREPVVIEARALPVEADIEEPAEGEPVSPEPTAETEEVDSDREDATRLVGAKSHLIGLSFVRAAALKRLAAALPPEDSFCHAERCFSCGGTQLEVFSCPKIVTQSPIKAGRPRDFRGSRTVRRSHSSIPILCFLRPRTVRITAV